jgi:hypothetical protein
MDFTRGSGAGVLDSGGKHVPEEKTGRARPLRRWAATAAWALAALAAFAVYLRLAETTPVNSDGAGQAIQAWDMLHGNPLLKDWRLSQVSFYTTDTPQDIVAEMVRGYGYRVVQAGAAITYTLVMLLAALLAKGRATGREAAVRVAIAAGIMLAPQLGHGTSLLLSSPDHLGTALPVLLAWLVVDRCGRRWYVPVVTALLLAVDVAGDRLGLVIAVLPLLAVCAVRIGQGLLEQRRGGRPGERRRLGIPRPLRFEAALAAAAVVSAVVAALILHLISSAGGFVLEPLSTRVVPWPVIVDHHVPLAGQGLLLLAGADFIGLPAGIRTFFVMLHVAGVALAACAITVTAWRFLRGKDIVAQLLLAGIAANVVVFVMGTYAVMWADNRHMEPVLPFAAVLAGRQLAGPLIRMARRGTADRGPVLAGLARRTLAPVLGLVLAGYVAGLGLELTAPPAPPQNAQLTAWLEAHKLGTGLSGYWEASVVTLTSGGRVPIRTVQVVNGKLTGSVTETKASWYDPARSYADFVVLYPGVPGYVGFTGRSAAVATFGEPAQTYHVGQYTILLWHKNLLADLGPAPRPA